MRERSLVLTGVFSSAPLPFFSLFFFYVGLERGDGACLGKAEACCGVEDAAGKDESRHSGDSE